jgi:Ig-like domain CHU_C associated
MQKFFIPSLIGLLSFSLHASTEAALQFTNIPPAFSGVPAVGLTAAAWDGGVSFAAVGPRSNSVSARFDGSTMVWTPSAMPRRALLTSLAYGNGIFLAGGTNGAIFSSSDGVSWTFGGSALLNNSSQVRGLAYNGGRFVAASSLVNIYYADTSLAPWHQAGFSSSGSSFLESWRGVTPNSAGGFIAVGVLGDIRVSSDGANWTNPSGHALSTSQPDLFAITSDGGDQFVAVGAKSSVLVSTDGGVTWTASLPFSQNALNAVAFTSPGFLAAGAQGTIVSSPDGVTWNQESSGLPGGFNVNLLGAAFATSGQLQGVGMIVGTNGAILLVGTPPEAPVKVTDSTNCANSAPNPPLVASLTPDSTHPAATVVIDWYNAASGGALVASATNSFVPPDTTTSPNAATIYTYFAEARDLRTGFVSANRTAHTLTINPRPTATLISFSVTNCNEGAAYTLTNTLTGLGPWTVYWNDGATQPVLTASPGPVILTRDVFPTNDFAANTASNNIFFVTNVVSGDGCSANQSGDITGSVAVLVNPRPTASLLSFAVTNCNEGTAYTLTNTLTGIGPWTVIWNDGVTQTVPVTGPGPVLLTRPILPSNAFGANSASNNTFFVTSVANADGCVGDQAGDLTGSSTIVVNPRPTAVLTALTTTNCNDGTPFTLTNTLTGIGPWVVQWNDGTLQTNSAVAGGPVLLARTVFPTNAFGANSPSNNVYFVTSVSNYDTCVGDQAGDLTGTNTIVINPRPTAALTALSTTVCNDGASFTLTNTLTGIGPWVVRWNDGTMQTNSNVGPGPVLLTRAVAPTNSTGANAATTNVYFVTAVSNADSCIGNQPGDVTGTNTIIVNPRPTASLLSLNITNCNDGTPFTLTNTLTGVGPWVVQWNDGTRQTNLTAGAGPVVLTRQVFPTNASSANAVSNNAYFVTSVSNFDGCLGNQAGDITGSSTITINPRPTAFLSAFNPTTCNDGSSFTLTNTLTGIGRWVIRWNDGTAQTNNSTSGGPVILTRLVFPTNTSTATPSNNVYFVTSVSNSDGCIGNQPGDILGTNIIVVNPTPNAPVSGGNAIGCVGITNSPLSVTVGSGESANWYNAASNLVASSTTAFVPTNTAPGTYQFFVSATNSFGCESKARTEVDLTLQTCTNSLAISLIDTNAVVEWYGNFVLQSSTNLAPQFWMTVTKGIGGTTNFWTNAVTLPPDNNYFRLYAPTN